MISFGADTCRDLDTALDREWLETSGLGGFASSPPRRDCGESR
jgi:hypothetical protein